MSAELYVDQAVRIVRGRHADRIGRVVRFDYPLVSVRIPGVGLVELDELDIEFERTASGRPWPVEREVRADIVEPPDAPYSAIPEERRPYGTASRASVAEPEGYDDHLDSIELRVVRLPRKVAPPINMRVSGITAFGRVAGRGIAAFVPKGGA